MYSRFYSTFSQTFNGTRVFYYRVTNNYQRPSESFKDMFNLHIQYTQRELNYHSKKIDQMQNNMLMAMAGIITIGLSTTGFLYNQIHRIDSKIDSVDTKLSAKIDSVDTKLSAKIDSVDTKLSAKIDKLEQSVAEQNKLLIRFMYKVDPNKANACISN